MNPVQASRPPYVGAQLTNIVLGIWVALSPFILGFTQNFAKWNNIGVGLALVLVAVLAGWGDEAFEGLVVPLGIWLFASPFVIGFSIAAFLANNVSMAFIVIAAGAMSDGLRSPGPYTPSPPAPPI